MDQLQEQWHPGSFTKNFGWGSERLGLKALHEAIRIGYNHENRSVLRDDFIARIEVINRPWHIPVNFFLYNYVHGDQSFLAADELTFQALEFDHSADFDRLALFAFNISLVGRWLGSRSYQSRPALWSTRYITERLGPLLNWDTSRVTADDIEGFISRDPRYRAKTSRKVATNLAYLYRVGRLEASLVSEPDRSWINAAFLLADRVTFDQPNIRQSEQSLSASLLAMSFMTLTGPTTEGKSRTLDSLVKMYIAVRGIRRFDIPAVNLPNDQRSKGLIDRSFSRIVKEVPYSVDSESTRASGLLLLDHDETVDYNPELFFRNRVLQGLSSLKAASIRSELSTDEHYRKFRE